MATNLTMPRLSDTMEVGTIVKWHVKPGDKVSSGGVVADVETDKATMELQSFEDAVVGELAVKEGQSVPVGTTILIWQGGQSAGGTAAATRTTAAGGADEVGSATATATVAESKPAASHSVEGSNGHAERVFASPLARKIAADNGLDLASLNGSGPSGRIVRKDVEAAIAGGRAARTGRPDPAAETAPATDEPRAPATAPAPEVIKRPKPMAQRGTVSESAAAMSVPPIAALMMPSLASALEHRVEPLSNMRRTIAGRLVESKTTIPHYQVSVSVRMDALLALRAQLNDQLASQKVKLSVNDFLVRACALAMHGHPYVNSRWGGTRGEPAIELMDRVNIGVAISLPAERGGGLVVATLRDADSKGLRLISTETRAYADKARTRGLSIEDMSDSTFTISNLGMYGVDHFTAIINPPNVAILAVGAAVKQPVVEPGPDGEDRLAIGHVMAMTMSSDHRVIDGAMAAQYLATVKEMLEKPATLLV
ncbi:MAG: 2-oxo acid dehydrogenase subunit E2 [Phycisphaeraceae bacterium]|nr:2-oxo acid dehydrogenase subunit E2 [Phycisphaeraceae bacterium]